MVKGGDSCSEGCGFESQHCILDGHFSHTFVVRIVMFEKTKISDGLNVVSKVGHQTQTILRVAFEALPYVTRLIIHYSLAEVTIVYFNN